MTQPSRTASRMNEMPVCGAASGADLGRPVSPSSSKSHGEFPSVQRNRLASYCSRRRRAPTGLLLRRESLRYSRSHHHQPPLSRRVTQPARCCASPCRKCARKPFVLRERLQNDEVRAQEHPEPSVAQLDHGPQKLPSWCHGPPMSIMLLCLQVKPSSSET